MSKPLALEIATRQTSVRCTVTCACGHTGDFDDFTSTPVLGDLPPAHYQCQKCRRAWRVVSPPLEFWPDGSIRNYKPNTIVPIAPRL